MTPRADQVAQVVLSRFNQLPTRRKPTVRSNGLHEWIPLSGIVIERDGNLECVALATGMKCLPANKIPTAKGIVLHDWHAEILAIRIFNRFLLDECQCLLADGDSEIVERTSKAPGLEAVPSFSRPFKIKDGLKIIMYCSEAPCGDASMELTMAAQEDATPWEPPTSATDNETALSGREFFSQLGIVRRKPARRDAPPTLSKSCSDKLALRQCTSLLASLTSLVIEPDTAYLDTLVVPSSRYTEEGFKRAFSPKGRMSGVEDMTWSAGFSFRPFAIDTTELEFEYSKSVISTKSEKISASNVAAAWSKSGVEESIVGGVIQGSKTSDVRGASCMSRRRMWISAKHLAKQLDDADHGLQMALGSADYDQVKAHKSLAVRTEVVSETQAKALKGWVRNHGDSSFAID